MSENWENKLESFFGGEKRLDLTPPEFLIHSMEYLSQGMPIRYLSEDALREIIEQTCSMGEEYCQFYSELPEGKQAFSSIARGVLLRKLGYYGKNIKDFNRRRCISSFYNLLLSLEGLSPLRGFKMGNRWGDVLQGDPERVSVLPRKNN